MDAAFAWPIAVLPPRRTGGVRVSAPDPKAGRLPAAIHIAAIAASGDREAFKALFLYMAPRIKAYLMRKGVEGADETTQEVMLTVWRKAALFDPARGAGEAWIFTIARNAWIDAARRGRGAQMVQFDPLADGAVPAVADVGMLAAEDSRRVRAALDALSREQLEVLRMSVFDGEPHSAIAARLNLPLGTVKSRLRLAMRRLRELLGETQ